MSVTPTAIDHPSAAADGTPAPHALQCMEIHGGNRRTDTALSLHGLDVWIVSRPHGDHPAGGDIHYVSVCGSGRIARFVVADVAGHGPAADRMAVQLRKLMRRYINFLNQSRFARALNREFATLSRDGTFATAVLATFFAPTDELVCVNAGHPPPLWYRADQGRWRLLEPEAQPDESGPADLPLGVDAPTQYRQFAVRLGVGDLVLIYTDSLIESRDDHGRDLGVKGLTEVVTAAGVDHLPRFCHRVLAGIARRSGSRPLEDDVTLLLIRHNGADPPWPSVGDVARVMGKMLGLIPV